MYFRFPTLQRDNPEEIFPKFLNFFLIGLQICNFSFSLIKLLAFSEVEKQLHFIGVWLSIIWNILSFICVHALYEFCLFRKLW